MECRRGVRQTEGHHCVLEKAEPRGKGCLVLVVFGNRDVMVAHSQIQRGKVLRVLSDRVDRLADTGKWVTVFNRLFIQFAEINAEPDAPVFLSDQNWGRTEFTVRLFNDVVVDEFLDLFVSFLLKMYGESSCRLFERTGALQSSRCGARPNLSFPVRLVQSRTRACTCQEGSVVLRLLTR